MSKKVIPLFPRLMKTLCSPHPLPILFKKYPVVLVGDELGAFYLDEWAVSTEDNCALRNKNNPLYLWDKRNQQETNILYMELVHAAFENGTKDIVIDMPQTAQPGINEGLQHYQRKSLQQTPEGLFCSTLSNALTMPMDSVVQMAGALGMHVHALNSGLTGIATLFREAKGITKVPFSDDLKKRISDYKLNGFEEDKETLSHILRRTPTLEEIDSMRQLMETRLNNNREKIEAEIFDESGTVKTIHETVGKKNFLGFFQNARLFQSPKDLDTVLRAIYGNNKVARVAMPFGENEEKYSKQPQYRLTYSINACTVTMTKAYASELLNNTSLHL